MRCDTGRSPSDRRRDRGALVRLAASRRSHRPIRGRHARVDDPARGQAATPWRTIGYALSQVAGTPSDPVNLRIAGGTYTESVALEPWGPPLRRIQARELDPRRRRVPHDPRRTGHLHAVVGASGARLDGVTVTGGNASGRGTTGTEAASSATGRRPSSRRSSSRGTGEPVRGRPLRRDSSLVVEDCVFVGNAVSMSLTGRSRRRGVPLRIRCATIERSVFSDNEGTTAARWPCAGMNSGDRIAATFPTGTGSARTGDGSGSCTWSAREARGRATSSRGATGIHRPRERRVPDRDRAHADDDRRTTRSGGASSRRCGCRRWERADGGGEQRLRGTRRRSTRTTRRRTPMPATTSSTATRRLRNEGNDRLHGRPTREPRADGAFGKRRGRPALRPRSERRPGRATPRSTRARTRPA